MNEKLDRVDIIKKDSNLYYPLQAYQGSHFLSYFLDVLIITSGGLHHHLLFCWINQVNKKRSATFKCVNYQKPEEGVAPFESACAEQGTTTEAPLAEAAAPVSEDAEPLLEKPVEENVDTPAPVESILVMVFQSKLLMKLKKNKQ